VDNQIRARVFISCGQQKDSDETKIAQDIADKLTEMDFDPYIAITEQTLKGVKENIFRRLSESEYLVFIDFKRDGLCQIENEKLKDIGEHRGSLFSNQELAIATYLDIDCIAFQEKGVRGLDGILRFIQANCTTFVSRDSLPDQIAEKVQEKVKKGEWNPNWRNEIRLERDSAQLEDVGRFANQYRPSRWFHIGVENLHRKKMARNCVVYLEKIHDLQTGEVRIPELVEFKWKGIVSASVTIPPKQSRYLDALYTFHDSPTTIYLGINRTLVDFSGYADLYTISGCGNYELTYVSFSEDFSPARKRFSLQVGGNLDNVQFCTKDV